MTTAREVWLLCGRKERCRNQEGVDFQRVETLPDTWYEVDGITIFAKRVNYETAI